MNVNDIGGNSDRSAGEPELKIKETEEWPRSGEADKPKYDMPVEDLLLLFDNMREDGLDSDS